MNNNRLRHKLLSILYNEYSVEKLQNSYTIRPVGLTFKEICEKLGINLTKLEEISFKLMEEKEVEKFSLDDDGLFIGERGLEAYSEKKYLKIITQNIKSKVTFWTSVIFGIITIFLTAYNLYLSKKNGSISNEQNIINKRMDSLEIAFDSLKIKIYKQAFDTTKQ